MKGGKGFSYPVCVQNLRWQSQEVNMNSPELPCGGQTEDTVPTAGAVPCIAAMAFLQLFLVTEGQKQKLPSKCNVCAPFYNVFLTVTNGTWLGSVYSEPIPGEFHRFVLWPKVQLWIYICQDTLLQRCYKFNPKLGACNKWNYEIN